MANTIGLQFEADTKQLKQADKDLDNLKKAADGADDAIEDLGDSFENTAGDAKKAGNEFQKSSSKLKKFTSGFRPAKNASQQLGFQLQDVAVQAQAGTNWFTIIGQQGSQLAGVLGPSGALFGAAIGIGAAVGGVISKAFAKTTETSEELTQSILEVADSFEKLGEAQKTVLAREGTKTIKEQREEISKLEDEIKDLTGTLVNAQERLDNESFGGRSGRVTEDALQNRVKQTRETIENAKAQIETLGQQIEESTQEVDKLSGGIELLRNQEDIELSLVFQGSDLSSLEEDRKKAEALIEQEIKIKEVAEKRQTNIELAELKARERAQLAASNRKIAIFEKDLQSARSSLLSNAELEQNFYTDSIMRLKEYGDLKNLTGEEINNLEAELYAAHLQRMANLEEKNNKERSDNISTSFNDIATGFAIFDNLTQAATVNRQKQLDNDLRNSEQFTAAQIANKEKEARRLFNIQKEADKASIASSTLVGVMAQVAQGNWLQAARVGTAGALSYAKASSNSYESPVSPSSAGVSEAPPSVANNTTNNNAGNINNFTFNNSGSGGLTEEWLREFFQSDGVLFDSNTAQGELLR